MSRKLAAACIAVMAWASAAHAQDARFFVSGALGAADGRLDGPYAGDRRDGSDVAGAVRAGAIWQGPIAWGIETGYVDLGKVSEQYIVNLANVRNEAHTRGTLLGGNATYRFDAPWYLCARGGWLHSWTDLHASASGSFATAASTTASGNGWYLGVGGGYDISERASVGLHYDFYHLKASSNGTDVSGHVGTLMVQLEYRY